MAKVITPKPVSVKMYKTGQTRGADDDVIFQNRVARSSTVLIPYEEYNKFYDFISTDGFENGFIVLIKPETFFSIPLEQLKSERLFLVK